MADKPHYLDHRKRLRERFALSASEGMRDYEILELLLTYAIPRRDVKPTAKKLIERFKNVPGILDADLKEIGAVEGMGEASSVLVKLIKDVCGLYLQEKMARKDFLASPKAVIDFARVKISGLAHESFMVIYANVKNEVLSHEILQEGTVDHAVVYPRRILESALAHHAAGLILLHNHPSGHCEPSASDKALTRKLCDAVRAVDIRILDHIIVGKGGYYSFAENGFLS